MVKLVSSLQHTNLQSSQKLGGFQLVKGKLRGNLTAAK